MKQHFLPVCYLKEFLNSDGKLHCLDISLLKYGRKVFDEPKYPNEVCRSKDFYTIRPNTTTRFGHMTDLGPLHIEESFHFYEREYPKIIGKIKKRQRALMLNDAELLLYAIVDFKIRNNYFREKIVPIANKSIIEEDLSVLKQKIRSSESKNSNIKANALLNVIDNVQVDFLPTLENNAQSHLSSMALRKSKNDQIHTKILAHLLQFEWTVLTSKHKFITNDNPGVSIDENDVVQNTKFDKNYVFFFPLTPSLCLSISPARLDLRFRKVKSQKNLKFIAADNQFIDFINDFHGYHLTRYIFSNNSGVIGDIADKINRISEMTL